MKFGVPWDGIKLNAGVTSVVTFVIIGNPLGFFLGVAFHMALRELTRIDPHFFQKGKLLLKTKMKSVTGHIWGGSRLQPSPARVRRAAEMRSSL